MNQAKSIHSIKPLIRANKNFVYKDKKYPIDFSLIKKNSNYFYNNRDQYKMVEDIQLSDDFISITEDSIRSFISSCQNEPFEINDSNVFSLHQLSTKYDVPCVISLTEEYIKDHNKSLVFQSIQYKIQLQEQHFNDSTISISLENDEESIASNFFDFINNEHLLNLPIPVLYRIVNHPKLDINQMDEIKKTQFIDFLFKCLQKHKKEASILFLNLDLENQRIDIFSKLIIEYSDTFDFSMINPKFLMKTTTDLLSELSKLKNDYSNSISQVNELLGEIKKEKQKQQELVDLLKQFVQDQLKNEKESLEILKKQIEVENKNTRDEVARNVNDMRSLVSQNNQMRSFITKDV